jgi:adenosylcobinamide-GDP ribazoletransferase
MADSVIDPPAGAGSPADRPAASGSILGDGLRLSVGTLTALPVPPPRRVDRPVAATAMLLAPVVGLVPGLAAAVVCLAANAAGAVHLVAAALALGTVALATRGLHLDGLADTADGLSAGYDREHALAVMHRGNTGPSGAAAVVLVLLVQVSALSQALDRHGPAAALVAVLAGRAMLAIACARGVPAARPGGLGATVAGAVPRWSAVVVLVLVAAACLGLAGPAGPAGVAAAALAVAVLLRRAVQRLGGINGDVLGACVEAGTAAALLALALLP